MKTFHFNDDKELQFSDDYERGNYSKSKLKVIQYFDNGTAVHVTLNEKEVEFLRDRLNEFNHPH